MVLSLEPPVGFSPTFVTPPLMGQPAEVVEQARSTSLSEVHAELEAIAEVQTLPAWTRTIDSELYQRFCDGLSDLYDALLRPYWSAISDLHVADRALRTRHMLQGGVDRLLREANPQYMRWNPPVLEIRMPNGIDRDFYLEGHGILLVPTLFRHYSLVDTAGYPQPVVTYPAGLDQPIDRLTLFAEKGSTAGDPAGVAALLGVTRAAVLRTIAEHQGCSTKELAALTHISSPSASEHATILRRAGLVNTTRYRNTVIHTATELGAALLGAVPDASGG